MTPEQIQIMASGLPPLSIGKDHEEVITWLANQHIALQQQVNALAALAEERRVFIVNGAEMGYIELPVFDEDPATATYHRCLLSPKFAADAVIREIGTLESTPETAAIQNEWMAKGVDVASDELSALATRSDIQASGHLSAASLYLKLVSKELREGDKS